MKNAGIDVLLDDRKDRAGVKFKDADLIGYPVRITVSPKLLDADEVEIKVRRDGATSNVKVDDCAQTVKDIEPAFICMIRYEEAKYSRYNSDSIKIYNRF